MKEKNKAKYYNGIYKDTSTFLKAVSIGLIAIMPFAFPLLIDKSYYEAYAYIPILALAIYYTSISNFFGGIFGAYKDTKVMGYTTMVAAAMNIIINLIFMPRVQIYAAAFSTLIANFVVYLYRKIKLRKYIKLRDKFDILYWILMTITIVSYYYNKMIINIIVFIIVLGYCIYTNRKIIGKILIKIKNRMSKEEVVES